MSTQRNMQSAGCPAVTTFELACEHSLEHLLQVGRRVDEADEGRDTETETPSSFANLQRPPIPATNREAKNL